MTESAALPSRPRSETALILFIIFAPMLLCGMFAYHTIAWFAEQMAIASGSLAVLANAGWLGMAVQAVTLTIFTAALWRLTRDERFRPIYAGWFGAALVSFPAIGLRFLGPNNDQLGALAQIVICLVGAAIAFAAQRGKVEWKAGLIPAALMVAALGILPLAIIGAFGSPADLILDLLAGLSFGLFAALLFRSTAENILLNALGIAGVLVILGSEVGYDGGQLVLLVALPVFALAIAALMPSVAGAATLTGLLAAAAFAFIDPTELSIVLQDFLPVAMTAGAWMIVIGALMGVVALIVRAMLQRAAAATWTRPAAALGAGLLWLALIAAYVVAGHRGWYGDRLFVIMKEQADLSKVAQISNRNERLTAAYDQLTALANESQADLRGNFDRFGIKYKPYYLVNAIEVQGGTLVRLYLLTRPEVQRVIPSPRLRPIPAAKPSPGPVTSVSGEPQWNIQMIGADKVWQEFGARGKGIVVGQSDSGVDGNHPALADQYRGRASGDDYNWYDPWEGTKSPNDEGGHGTHTLGTILGKDGIGIAPEAQWMACVNLNRNLGNPALYLDCMQFMLAPFPQGGDPLKDGDPTKAAYVLNNSWGCPEIEGCDPTSLQAAADHLRAAGIFVVVSTGNDGPNCNTVNAPLSLYASVFSVGAVDRSGNMADFSSRGPVTADGSGRMKPDIVAPGVDILSATPMDTYATFSGTSMAGPHVAGAVALLWSADPSLIGDIDRTEQILIKSAQPYSGQTGLGCFEGDTPNAAYGYGVLDVYAAVKLALGK